MWKEAAAGIRLGAAVWLLAFAIIFAVSYYSWAIEPKGLVVKRSVVEIGLEKPVKIVFISDIHAETISDGFLESAVGMANAENPDYVFLGGDYTETGGAQIERLAPLRKLKAKKGAFAVLGNHDYLLGESACSSPDGDAAAEKTAAFLESMGITVLRNGNIDTGDFVLAGVDDFWACKSNYSKAMEGADRSRPVVLLTHNQESVPEDEYRKPNLVLAGHTHCGQARLPIIGSVPKLFGFRGEYDMGLYRLDGGSYMYTSCGIGGGPPRLLAPPEITVIELH